MRTDEAAKLARDKIAVPWDDLRAARGHKRLLASLKDEAGARPRTPSRARLIAIFVAAAALLFALFFWLRPGGDVAPQARLDFADGSFVVPEPGAQVIPERVAADRIEVRQSSGTARYDVAPRPERKFVIWVDGVRVEVLGTAFSVEKQEAAVRVAVTRGRVLVSRGERSVVLGAGEEVVFASDASAAAAEPAGAAKAPEPDASAESPTASAEPAQSGSSPAQSATEPTAAELFRQADDARAAGQTVEALRLLRLLVERHPKDGRVTLAAFTIGRLEAQRGNLAAAAASFESCGNALGGEALAEAALARSSLGQSGKAASLASAYLARFPNGARAKQMAELAR